MVYVFFKLNQQYIEENLCVNRWENITVCGGSCFLSLQLDKNQSEEDPLPTPMEERKQVSPVYFLPSSPMALAQSPLFESFPRVEDQVRLSGYSQSLFRPPRS